jgi:hypothetical protein
MPKSTKHDAGQQPLPQQRDERAGVGGVEEQRLGSARERRRVPKLPHERDQATGGDATAADTGDGNRELMRRAKEDIESGRQDTDRGPVADSTYHKLRKQP